VRYKITRHEEVRFDLAGILDFIGNYAGYGLGDQKIDEINAAIAELREFPHIGAPRNDVFSGLRALSSVDKAVICFTVNDETRIVKIVCVTYAGQDWQAIAKTRK
jgi:plasmid stabilization system protein ParE